MAKIKKMGFEKNRRFTVDWHNQPTEAVIGGKHCKFKSRQEYKWAQYLQLLKDNGVIFDWEYEPKTFWFEGIKRGVVSYKPDFKVIEDGRHTVWHEIKIWLTQKDIVKFKRMAKYYPDIEMVLVMNTGTKKANQMRLKDNALKYVSRIIYASWIFRKLGIK